MGYSIALLLLASHSPSLAIKVYRSGVWIQASKVSVGLGSLEGRADLIDDRRQQLSPAPYARKS